MIYNDNIETLENKIICTERKLQSLFLSINFINLFISSFYLNYRADSQISLVKKFFYRTNLF